MSTEPGVETALAFFKALANEARLRLVGLLSNGERSVDDLASRLDLTSPTVSHHLARLRELGLVEMRAEGTRHLYRLDLKNLETMTAAVFRSSVPARRSRDDPASVLDHLLDGETLTAIPARGRRRAAVLEW